MLHTHLTSLHTHLTSFMQRERTCHFCTGKTRSQQVFCQKNSSAVHLMSRCVTQWVGLECAVPESTVRENAATDCIRRTYAVKKSLLI